MEEHDDLVFLGADSEGDATGPHLHVGPFPGALVHRHAAAATAREDEGDPQVVEDRPAVGIGVEVFGLFGLFQDLIQRFLGDLVDRRALFLPVGLFFVFLFFLSQGHRCCEHKGRRKYQGQ